MTGVQTCALPILNTGQNPINIYYSNASLPASNITEGYSIQQYFTVQKMEFVSIIYNASLGYYYVLARSGYANMSNVVLSNINATQLYSFGNIQTATNIIAQNQITGNTINASMINTSNINTPYANINTLNVNTLTTNSLTDISNAVINYLTATTVTAPGGYISSGYNVVSNVSTLNVVNANSITSSNISASNLSVSSGNFSISNLTTSTITNSGNLSTGNLSTNIITSNKETTGTITATNGTINSLNCSSGFFSGSLSSALIYGTLIGNSIFQTNMTTPGVIHNSNLGGFSSSLIIDSDIGGNANINPNKINFGNTITSANITSLSGSNINITGNLSANNLNGNTGNISGNLICNNLTVNNQSNFYNTTVTGALTMTNFNTLGVVHSYANGILYDAMVDRKSTRLNSSHIPLSRMPSSA